MFFLFFFFNDTATTEIYTLSLHDALPISSCSGSTSHYNSAFRIPHSAFYFLPSASRFANNRYAPGTPAGSCRKKRSEEHTSELQSRLHLVCRLLLEKKKKHTTPHTQCPPCNHTASR